MKVTGLGVDIEDIARFRKKPYKNHKAFYQRIFSKNELEYCLKQHDPAQHFAVRFCAKEAFVKATAKKVMNYKEIEVVFFRKKPYVMYKNKRYLLSLSHDVDKAVGVVVV